MKLSNIVSKDLLPEFAESISWVMNAFDHIIQDIKARSVSIDAPLTMESIEALTDEDLQALYNQYGLALYYPDISRARRNWMLYNMARIWRYLGTPKAVEFLCQYIFSDIDIELKVHDNGAFDEEGRLVNPDLVDVFDIEIIPGVTILPPEANQRILENVIRFSRNSQALRQIYYSYDTFVSQNVSPALPYNGIVAVENVLNEALCEDSPEPPTPPGPGYEDLTLYLQSGSSKNMQFSATSATTTMSKSGYSGDVVYQLYTDSGRSVAFTPDLTKIYRIGYYDGTEWKELKYQSIDSMPETITSNLSDSVSCFIILNSGLLWFLTNLNRTITSPSYEVNIRAYPDSREWTQETLYLETVDKYYQTNVTCYTSPTPNNSYINQLYTDSGCTTKFYYDLDKDYLVVSPSTGEPIIRQRIWDMPTATKSSLLGAVFTHLLLKTGFLHFVTNYTGSQNYSSATSISIKSAPKQYDEPTITLDLGFSSDFSSRTFAANDYWFAFIRNSLDEQKALDFGLEINRTSSSGVARLGSNISAFNIELVALCDEYENTVTTDMHNFYIDSTTATFLEIRSIAAYNTATNYWRVRITRRTT